MQGTLPLRLNSRHHGRAEATRSSSGKVLTTNATTATVVATAVAAKPRSKLWRVSTITRPSTTTKAPTDAQEIDSIDARDRPAATDSGRSAAATGKSGSMAA